VARTALDPNALGLAIRLRREELGFSRPDLAGAATLSYPYVYEVERGKKLPSQDALEKLAGALDIEPATLEARAVELADEQAVGGVVTAGTPRSPGAEVGRIQVDSRAEADALVNQLTAAVIARVEPIVRDAIATAIEVAR
jgi:transcriptional regulator with XRE-family HTH domain